MSDDMSNLVAFWLLAIPFGLLMWAACIFGLVFLFREGLRITLNIIKDWNYR